MSCETHRQRVRVQLRTIAMRSSDEIDERITDVLRQQRTDARSLGRLADDIEYDCNDAESADEIRAIVGAMLTERRTRS